ncbi:hypothetical protein B0J17DRAFT_631574 [Rhizoctonia solani]|nr:hypothetical protein B0J17DRAFT_631574 [Rhizoctonia solani]
MVDQSIPPLVLTIDYMIILSHLAAVSYYFNPRNLEYAQRQTAELIAWKLPLEISFSRQCTVTTEFSFWPWKQHETDDAVDLPALLVDGQLEGTESLHSNGMIGVLESNDDTEMPQISGRKKKKGACGAIVTHTNTTRRTSLTVLLYLKAGFMFGNRLYQRLPYVIGIAMAAEAWRYAIFDQDKRPTDFDSAEAWKLTEESWTPVLCWGTPESDQAFEYVKQAAEDLLEAMDLL